MERNNIQITVPVLLIGFNRPDYIETTFQKIREARPTRLYVAIDGARKERPEEQRLVDKVISIVKQVDWDCEVSYRFNETNRGAEVTVSSAVRWVLEKELYTVVLEDDIVAPLSFFYFMQEMLERYKDASEIRSVSGNNFTPLDTENDYFFSVYGHIWGWGTWRRVWQDFDLNREVSKEHCSLEFTKTFTNSLAEAKYWKRRFETMRKCGAGKCTWDAVFSYQTKVKGQLAIVPRVNLATNIGVEGLHARGESSYHFHKADADFRVERHPEEIKCLREYDAYHFANHFPKQKTFATRLIGYIKRLILQKG